MAEQLSFIVEWFDPQACFARQFLFTFNCTDNTVDMYDTRNQRSFLKRTRVDNVHADDLYVGGTVNVLSRQLKIVDYGNDHTRTRLGSTKDRTLALIKPDAINKTGNILDAVYSNDLRVTKLKMCILSHNQAAYFHRELNRTEDSVEDAIRHWTSGPLIAMELRGDNVLHRWREVIGPADPAAARSAAPSSLRARFGQDPTRNAVYGSDQESAMKELDFFFPRSGSAGLQNTATFTDCTCCVIKPHAVNRGLAGTIIGRIQEAGFDISAMQMFHMDKANSEEFLEVYKGVVQEYPMMVAELTAGPCIAMEIRAKDAPRIFREFVGPADPEIARHLRPRTLRAQFGIDRVQNAVHCTDLPDDGLLEVEYFFRILDK